MKFEKTEKTILGLKPIPTTENTRNITYFFSQSFFLKKIKLFFSAILSFSFFFSFLLQNLIKKLQKHTFNIIRVVYIAVSFDR